MSVHTFLEREEVECSECDRKEEWMEEIEQDIERKYTQWMTGMDPLAPEWIPAPPAQVLILQARSVRHSTYQERISFYVYY